MARHNRYLRLLLGNLRALRERAGLSPEQLEEQLIWGPGWIMRFEEGETIPSTDVLLQILHKTGSTLGDLIEGLPPHPEAIGVERQIFAEQQGNDIVIYFHYADFDASYVLANATVEEFDAVIRTLRNGLRRIVLEEETLSAAIKSDSVAAAFLKAVSIWPDANPSDIWWFVIYRAYCDPYNHPAQFARLDFPQSWKRTGGWALEEVLLRHYGNFLHRHGIRLIINGETKRKIVRNLDVGERLEVDKIDIILAGDGRDRPTFFGVIHVKSSFAERRTDDVPMSTALVQDGYTSPLWTMDCKSMPSDRPTNRGELGEAHGERSAKRKDIEDEGYFTGCFSYNQNTNPSPNTLPSDRRIYVCHFRNPEDAFSQFIINR